MILADSGPDSGRGSGPDLGRELRRLKKKKKRSTGTKFWNFIFFVVCRLQTSKGSMWLEFYVWTMEEDEEREHLRPGQKRPSLGHKLAILKAYDNYKDGKSKDLKQLVRDDHGSF